MEERKKSIQESRIEQVYQVRPEHLNGAGRLFGGKLMEWIDEIAGLVGIRHSNGNTLRFIQGAFLGDLIVLIGRVTYVGNTSMEIRVDTYIEDFEGMRRPINRAYLTLVGVTPEGALRRVPGILLETEGERAEWQAGERRKELREQRRREGY